jgi:hypothetical protein
MFNRVKKNDRNDVVCNALTENTTEKFGLFRVVDNTHCRDYIGTTEQSCIEQNLHYTEVRVTESIWWEIR